MMLEVKLLDKHAKLPKYAHEGDAGMDLFSIESKIIHPGERSLIKTGISIGLPPNAEAQVRPKSGLAIKNGITILNTPGTIDYGYRGEVGVILINHSQEEFAISIGMKIAQIVIKPVITVTVEQVEELSQTQRGTGGFGSTGIN